MCSALGKIYKLNKQLKMKHTKKINTKWNDVNTQRMISTLYKRIDSSELFITLLLYVITTLLSAVAYI